MAIYQEPIIKWPGGKTKELTYILNCAPNKINRYVEPFVGGGSVFLNIVSNQYYVNDASTELMRLYNNISIQDETFFKYINKMATLWDYCSSFFDEIKNELISIYLKYRSKAIDNEELSLSILNYVSNQKEQFIELIPNVFKVKSTYVVSEFHRNIYNKMTRMRKIELTKQVLSQDDLEANLGTPIKGSIYMIFRYLYNTTRIDSKIHDALFFYIRNFAYSGMFRYNKEGEFNVPYGGIAYNNKSLVSKINYYKSSFIQSIFSKTTLFDLDFEDFLNHVNLQSNDFMFLDPPYDTEFSTYANNSFSQNDQKRLAHYLINKCSCKWLMIIKNTQLIYDLYSGKNGVFITSFDKKYQVSFMNRNNKNVEHLIIKNYV